MLSDQQLADEVKKMTYKEEWHFGVKHVDYFQGLYFCVAAEVPNSYRPEETTTLYINSPIPPMPDIEFFRSWVLWRLKQIEIHEAMEWFKIDGKMHIDPHEPIQFWPALPLGNDSNVSPN